MRIAVMALMAVLVDGTAVAQELRLDIRGGRVTLEARDVPVDRILAQWETVGGTTIVGREQIPSPLVTLRLEGVSEREALDAILRDVSGFVARQRAEFRLRASIYDRIVILARSTTPAAAVMPMTPARDPRPALEEPAVSHLPSGGGSDVAVTPFGARAADPAALAVDEAASFGGHRAAMPLGIPPAGAHDATPGAHDVTLVEGRSGRRAEPGMVPVVVPPAALSQPGLKSPVQGLTGSLPRR